MFFVVAAATSNLGVFGAPNENAQRQSIRCSRMDKNQALAVGTSLATIEEGEATVVETHQEPHGPVPAAASAFVW